jgi:NAD(P)-dependent dehydrogenase (short-subunit alcohol dehydrogenase family)
MFPAGLRAQLTGCRFGVPLMLPHRRGLVVNTTFVSRGRYLRPVLYDVVKHAANRMVSCMAEELRPHGIAVIALSPGWINAERMHLTPDRAAQTESTEFVGRAVAALAADPTVIELSGQLFRSYEVARRYGFTDVNGRQVSPWWERFLADERRDDSPSARAGHPQTE